MLAGALACFVALVAGVALVGWLVGAQTLASVVPGESTMKGNTALAMVCAAGALWLAARVPAGRDRLRDGLAVAAVLIAGAALAQDLFGVSLGVDELLFADPGP